nr:hypothetical protein [Rhodococcus sp. MSC1_016]
MLEHDDLYLLDRSQMSTLLGLIAKLSADLVPSSPRLQLAIGWATPSCSVSMLRSRPGVMRSSRSTFSISPLTCLRGCGWKPMSYKPTSTPLPTGSQRLRSWSTNA